MESYGMALLGLESWGFFEMIAGDRDGFESPIVLTKGGKLIENPELGGYSRVMALKRTNKSISEITRPKTFMEQMKERFGIEFPPSARMQTA